MFIRKQLRQHHENIWKYSEAMPDMIWLPIPDGFFAVQLPLAFMSQTQSGLKVKG